MDLDREEAEEALDGFEPLPDEQEQPAESQSQPSSKPSYAFVAVLTTLLLAYTNTSLTGMKQPCSPAPSSVLLLSIFRICTCWSLVIAQSKPHAQECAAVHCRLCVPCIVQHGGELLSP